MANNLDEAIEAERKLCRCEERLGYDEEGNYSCDGFCAGCRNYDPIDVKCDIRENVRVALCEDAWERDHEYLDPHPRSEED